MNKIDSAINKISDTRSYIGAVQNNMQAAIGFLSDTVTNTRVSVGRISDTDYSNAATQISKQQILTQAGTAMLAQANQSAQLVLSLVKDLSK